MSKADSKQMWKYLRELDQKSFSPPPSKLKDGDKEITDPLIFKWV